MRGAAAILVTCFTVALFAGTMADEGTAVRFDGHQVLRVTPKSAGEVRALYELGVRNNVDWWKEPSRVGADVDFRVSPEALPTVHEELARIGLQSSVFVECVQTAMERQMQRASSDFHGSYHTYDEIVAWLKDLASAHSDLVTIFSIGKTYEGNDMWVARVSPSGRASRVSGSAGPKPAVWFDSLIHAREWITGAVVPYVLEQLVTGYGSDSSVRDLLDAVDVYVLPVFNVDGYKYTHNGDRMWRKTRSPTSFPFCKGTDPNRNWGFHWGEAGTSKDPCSESYEGKEAFSEVEVRTVADYLKNNTAIQGYINFHSYSELWMEPWGWTEKKDADFADQDRLAAAAVKALSAVHGTEFEHGAIATTIYPASGSSADYTYGSLGVKYSYGVELRDKGQYGFLLPASEIIPSGEETLAAIKAFIQFVAQNPAPRK